MSAISGTGVSLSATYYLRNFYSSNRDATSESKRKTFSSGTLSEADATALHRAAKKLRNFSYEEDTSDSANIYGSVSAFIDTYNNTLSSGNSSSDSSINRYAKYLKNLSKEHSDELEDIGITVNSDGTLTANDNLLKSAKVAKVKELFSRDADYVTKVGRYSRKMMTKAEDLLYIEGLGESVNTTV